MAEDKITIWIKKEIPVEQAKNVYVRILGDNGIRLTPKYSEPFGLSDVLITGNPNRPVNGVLVAAEIYSSPEADRREEFEFREKVTGILNGVKLEEYF